uniref:Uncharacterized protein n=1 Tax=Oryza brachyantha TaxID=4533 RepID=J3MFX5_ORYBR
MLVDLLQIRIVIFKGASSHHVTTKLCSPPLHEPLSQQISISISYSHVNLSKIGIPNRRTPKETLMVHQVLPQ